jgi:hypothetical protein
LFTRTLATLPSNAQIAEYRRGAMISRPSLVSYTPVK